LKKIINIFAILVLLTSNFAVPEVTHAKTLGDLKDELEQKQEEYNQNETEKKLTEEEISQTNAEITTIKNNISQTYIDIENIQKEIENLYEQIASKKSEVKQILNFLQVSNGESAYLEYIFGAKSFTDLIYRSAVAEQMASYNNKLVKEYNTMIEQSQKKQEEMQAKQVELTNYQSELETKVASLGETLETQLATSIDIQDDIDYQKEIIEMYESKGCVNSDNIATCGRSVLPKGTAFYRPLVSGSIRSNWGYRDYMGKSWHEGIDLAASEGTAAYAIGTGVVATVIEKSSCGGNMVIVHHNINGKNYTSVYAHLLRINVVKGQTVTRDTIVGYTGGYSTASMYGGYDTCTTGAHLHLTVATGLYGVDYGFYAMNYTYSIDPRSVINFPLGTGSGSAWSDRITAY
jgi:murein DD-endopeptidase MepM/ murein hydrolase activator NlpD